MAPINGNISFARVVYDWEADVFFLILQGVVFS